MSSCLGQPASLGYVADSCVQESMRRLVLAKSGSAIYDKHAPAGVMKMLSWGSKTICTLWKHVLHNIPLAGSFADVGCLIRETHVDSSKEVSCNLGDLCSA